MNAAVPLPPPLPDIQSEADTRGLALEEAGIRRLASPVRVRAGGREQATVATFSLAVALPATARGAHMSRFVELIEARTEALDPESLGRMTHRMLRILSATSGAIEARFPLFLAKRAPVSGAHSRLEYQARWRSAVADDGSGTLAMQVTVPVTSLCPCSKAISDYGAHNQRSLLAIEVETAAPIDTEELVAVAERASSCELYGLLKRVDEKYVTERAYENPKFAEDMVRDAALELATDPRVARYVVEAENLESIHNHSAYARLSGPPKEAK
jgi:GTP cyclohydrolase FolE2